VEVAPEDFGEERAGAREDVICSILTKQKKLMQGVLLRRTEVRWLKKEKMGDAS
jgi:hypothetical protein